MTTDNTLQHPDNNDEIDLLALLGVIIDYRWMIICITLLFAFCGFVYTKFATPIYEANTIIQIEGKKSGLSGLEDLAGMETGSAGAGTEIEILKSRWIVGKAVDKLQLDVNAKPRQFPVIGSYIARRANQNNPGKVAPARLGLSRYDWGGATIKIAKFDVPEHLLDKTLVLTAGPDNSFTLSNDESILLQGRAGEPVTSDGIFFLVETLQANPGTEFLVAKRNRLNVILQYQDMLLAGDKGKQTGMIDIRLQHPNARFAKNVLNELANLYVQQNIERMSAEAANSLRFLQEQMPQIKLEMENAEQRMNQYQISAKSVNISSETQTVLNQIVSTESSLSGLKLKQLEMSKKFTPEHPAYQSLATQIAALEDNKKTLEAKIRNLPETQQDLLRLSRDVNVSSQLYTQMLQKTQELDIARASTVGNVRIIDEAAVNMNAPVAPQGTLIITITTLAGAILAILLAFVHNLIHRGVENPSEIEALELPVYSSIPYSQLQYDAEKANKKTDELLPLLAREYPHDPSIEAIRSLHTSLHFALLEAPNNIIMFSGPSPQVGKSFVSVNLATLMAEAGKKVLLIDADMRKGYIHKFFGLSSTTHGLSTLLAKQEETSQCITRTSVNNLDLVTRGSAPPNPSELLLSQHFNDTLQQLSHQYDIIIIDTPPILAVADALIVSKVAGASFMVVRFGKNPLGEIRAALRRFETNGVKLKGAVLNATRKKSMNYYNYQKYGYGSYQYNYTSDKD